MKTLLSLVVLCMLCGCQTPHQSAGGRYYDGYYHTCFSDAQAVAVAKQAAADHYGDYWDYQHEQADFDWSPASPWPGDWIVFWCNPGASSGFQVIIDGMTGKLISAGKVPIVYQGPN